MTDFKWAFVPGLVWGFVGGVWGVLCSWLALPLDRLYRWLYRLPECKPGRCCCRRTCICLIQEPLK